MVDEKELFGQIDRFIGAVAQCQVLGMTLVSARKNELVTELPYTEQIFGNTDSGVIHGGAITTLLDTTAGCAVQTALPEFEMCPTLDLRVDYLRPAISGQSVFARASCFRVTKSIVFMRCEAYQGENTIASCVATFIRLGNLGFTSLDQALSGATYGFKPNQQEITKSESLKDVVEEVRDSANYEELIAAIPYAQLIGTEFVDNSDTRFFKLARKQSNIGNPTIAALHGGVIGGFMELAGTLHLLVSQPTLKYPKIIDFSLDYLRAGFDRETFAHCEVTRLGGRIANVEIRAWQESEEKPIALARSHFLLDESE